MERMVDFQTDGIMNNPVEVFVTYHEDKTMKQLVQVKLGEFEFSQDWRKELDSFLAKSEFTKKNATIVLRTPNFPIGQQSPCHGLRYNLRDN